MVGVIRLIEQGVIGRIYIYDRSRFTRNFYEYLELVDLFIVNNIEVIFTTTDSSYSTFSSNYLVEGFNGILIEEEGKGIARRTSDNNRKLPTKKFGYIVKKENNMKSYVLDSELQPLFKDLFTKASLIQNTKEFIELITFYDKEFNKKKKPIGIVKILTDPFYSGSEKIGNHYSPLFYVESVVSSELFSEVQKHIEPYVKRLEGKMNECSEENILTPYCASCKKKMIYRVSKVGESGIIYLFKES